MFNTKTKYIAERPGEARITLCDTSEANIKVGYKPQVNLDDYIEGIVNE
jgi:GDP-D-mannose dehydratase